ncbi:metal-sensing transcriptional repressor [Flavonifractor plautii]
MGHLQTVKNMVERGDDCSDVLIQLAAVRSALNSTGKIILKDHIAHCLVDAVETGDMKTVEQLNQAIDQFMR